MTIKNKGYEYILSDKEKKAFQIVFDVLNQIYSDDDTETDVENKMNEKSASFSEFRFNRFLTEYTRLGYEVLNFEVNGQYEE